MFSIFRLIMPNKDLTIAKGESPKPVDNLLPGYTFQRVSRYILYWQVSKGGYVGYNVQKMISLLRLNTGNSVLGRRKNRDCMTLEDKKLKKNRVCVFCFVT
uniref:Uncharacterized protein n=1 Tax=Cacopsylla melanoneura TaxID=428564 RepID=A0A8D8SHQ9_9HEMI